MLLHQCFLFGVEVIICEYLCVSFAIRLYMCLTIVVYLEIYIDH